MGIHFSGGVLVGVLPSGSIYGDFSGPVAPIVGTVHRNFVADITFTKLVLHTLVNVVGNVSAAIRVNNVVVESITLLSGTNTQNKTISISVHNGDYMTIDITAGTCDNLSVRLDY